MAKVTPIRPPRVGSRLASRVTTGYSLFVEGGDGRSAWARRWKDLIVAHAADLGDPASLSEAQVSLVRRASAMEIALEQIEARMSEGQDIDLDRYVRTASRLSRLLALLGIKRRPNSLDPQGELVRALASYAGPPIDDDDDEPGEA
jgi:hypothetical protein